METTERIVESYVRFIKGWFTLPNIKCKGQMEIDLLAIDPKRTRGVWRYHIESGVSISGSFSSLTAKPYSPGDLKVRVKKPAQTRTLGYFVKRKFGHPGIRAALLAHGFEGKNYKRVIVTWGWTADAERKATRAGVVLWDFRTILNEISTSAREKRTYFTDDTIRTLQLMAMALKHHERMKPEELIT